MAPFGPDPCRDRPPRRVRPRGAVPSRGRRYAPGGTRPGQVNTAFYCNRTVRAALDIQAMAKANNFLTLETRDSRPYTAFRGIPIRICDQILNNDARVV